jgi:dihydroflavonol-4-reductase
MNLYRVERVDEGGSIKMDRYFVTGATGHLGNVLIKELEKEGRQVVAFVKRGDDITPLKGTAARIVYGDVLDKKSLVEAIEKNDVVIHLAAYISITRRDERLVWDVNYGGTKNIVEAAEAKRAKRFVYVSSVHALPKLKRTIRENDFFERASASMGEYELSKKAATRYVFDHIKEGLSGAIIYPSGILGPGDYKQGEISELIKKIYFGWLPAYVSGGYAFCDVRDVAKAIIYASSSKGCDYIVSSGFLSIGEIVETTMSLSPDKHRPLLIPRSLAWLAIPFIGILSRLTKRKPLYTAYSLKTTKAGCDFSSDKLAYETGSALISPQKSLLDQIGWMKINGYLDKKKGRSSLALSGRSVDD